MDTAAYATVLEGLMNCMTMCTRSTLRGTPGSERSTVGLPLSSALVSAAHCSSVKGSHCPSPVVKCHCVIHTHTHKKKRERALDEKL